jgi:uncharacterized protein YfbU (UPF0304 family)
MRRVGEMCAGGFYYIEKLVLKQNSLVVSEADYLVLEENIRRFILPIGTLYHMTVTQGFVGIFMKIHSEEILKSVPRNVRDQIFTLSATDLDSYQSGDLKLQIEGSENNCGDKYASDAAIIVKRYACFLQSFTRQYNLRHDRECRLFQRKTKIYEIESLDELNGLIAASSVQPVILDKEVLPEDYKHSTVKDVVQGINYRVSIAKLLGIFGTDTSGYLSYIHEVLRVCRHAMWRDNCNFVLDIIEIYDQVRVLRFGKT